MAYKVIQWATGFTGKFALRGILQHPELELVGVWVHSEEKDGMDAGAICGLDPVGISATRDADALIQTDADCVCFMAADPTLSNPTKSGSHGAKLLEMMCRLLKSGKNVVATSLVSLLYPKNLGPEVMDRIEKACRTGGSSFHCTGIDPGFMGEVLMLNITSLSQDIVSLRCQEILNYATYNEPATLKASGFGQKPEIFKGKRGHGNIRD